METNELFHLNNNIRLLRIADTPLKVFPERVLYMKRIHLKVKPDAKNQHYQKSLNQIEVNYEK